MKTSLPKLAVLCAALFSVQSARAQVYQWAKGIGGTSTDRAAAVVYDAAGNVYVTGAFSGTVDFDPGTGTAPLTALGMTDIFIAKYSSTGAYVWAKSVGGTGGEHGGYSIALTSTGDVAVCGFFSATVDFDPGTATDPRTSGGYSDIFLLKLDKDGNYRWARTISDIYSGWATQVKTDKSGNIFVAGNCDADADFNPAGKPLILPVADGALFYAKYDAAGQCTWAKKIGAAGGGSQYIRAMELDAAGNIYLGGSFYGTVDLDPSTVTEKRVATGVQDLFLAKYDANGSFVWGGNTGSKDNVASVNSIAVDAAGNVNATGSFYNTVDFDLGTDKKTLSATNSGQNLFFAQYDDNGNYKWAHNVGAVSSSGGVASGSSLATDNSGNIYMTGLFSIAADFDPGSKSAMLTAELVDMFLASYTQDGNYRWAKSLPSKGSLIGGSYMNGVLALNPATDELYLAGTINDTTDFDLSAGVAKVGSNGSSDIFVAKYNGVGTAIGDVPAPGAGGLTVYPNPASGSVLVSYNLVPNTAATLSVYSVLGQQLVSVPLPAKTAGQQQYSLDCAAYGLQPGVYFLELNTGTERSIVQLMISGK